MFSLAGNWEPLCFSSNTPAFFSIFSSSCHSLYSLGTRADIEYEIVSHSLDRICGVDRLPTFAVMEIMGGVVAVNLNEQRARNPGIAELRHYATAFFI